MLAASYRPGNVDPAGQIIQLGIGKCGQGVGEQHREVYEEEDEISVSDFNVYPQPLPGQIT